MGGGGHPFVKCAKCAKVRYRQVEFSLIAGARNFLNGTGGGGAPFCKMYYVTKTKFCQQFGGLVPPHPPFWILLEHIQFAYEE